VEGDCHPSQLSIKPSIGEAVYHKGEYEEALKQLCDENVQSVRKENKSSG